MVAVVVVVAPLAWISAPPAAAVTGAVRTGFTSQAGELLYTSAGNPTASSVNLPFSLNFFGTTYTSLAVNENGNVTLDGSMATPTVFDLATTNRKVIAPYLADGDIGTSTPGRVVWSSGFVNGRNAFQVTWGPSGNLVGYYSKHHDKLNSVQLVLIDRSDVGPGNVDMEFNYDQVQWETGDNDGGVGGAGGSSAQVGYSKGTGVSGTFFKMSGSGQPGSFIDSNSAGLTHGHQGSTQLGRYVFAVRTGTPNPVNIAPTVQDDSATTAEDTAVDVSVLANDSDPDGNLVASTVAVTANPSHGVANPNTTTGKIRYTPNHDYNGSDSFTYRVCDNGNACNTANISMTITPVNDPPVALDDSASTAAGAAVAVDVLANDTDVDDAIDPSTVVVSSGPTSGSTSVNPTTGKITYTPNSGFTGSDQFTYHVCDVGSACSADATVRITVGSAGALVVNDDYVSTPKNVAVAVAVVANDTDTGATIDPSTVTVTTAPTHGTAAPTAGTPGSVTYTPAADYIGADSFAYQVCDSASRCASATVHVTVTDNEPPNVAADSAHTPVATPVSVDVTANDSDPDGSIDATTVQVTVGPAHGQTSVNPTTGVVIYTPTRGFFGTDTFTYRVCDDVGACATATVTILVIRPPSITIGDPSVVEGGPGTTASLDFPVWLSRAPFSDETVQVSYATGGGTATVRTDYVPLPLARLTFATGQTTATVHVTVNGDARHEKNETVLLQLSDPAGAVLADASGTGTIIDDEGQFSLSVSDAAVVEGASGTTTLAHFTVSISAPPIAGEQVSVQCATEPTTTGSATSDVDYVSLPVTTLTFTAGQLTKSVDVTVNGDATVEGNETFVLRLSHVKGAVIADASGLGTIVDDDVSQTVVPLPSLSISDGWGIENGTGTAVFTVTLSRAPDAGQSVHVTYSTGDKTATAGSDYLAAPGTVLTFGPGETTKTFAINVFDDAFHEGNETFIVKLSKPVGAVLADASGTGTIVDDEGLRSIYVSDAAVTEDSGSPMSFTVSAWPAPAPGETVSVTWQTSAGTATAGSDYTSHPGTRLTFASSQTATVVVTVDQVVESDEAFSVLLSNAVGGVVGDASGAGTILDDD